jgi:hypothetical protein
MREGVSTGKRLPSLIGELFGQNQDFTGIVVLQGLIFIHHYNGPGSLQGNEHPPVNDPFEHGVWLNLQNLRNLKDGWVLGGTMSFHCRFSF